jgi:VanZ family protein
VARLRLPLVPKWLRWLAVLAVAGVILYSSVITAPPGVDRGFELVPHFDKILHAAAYAGLGVTMAYALLQSRFSRRQRAVLVLSVAATYGVVIEVLQGQLTARTASVLDALANVLGACFALGWYAIVDHVEFVRARRLLAEQRSAIRP